MVQPVSSHTPLLACNCDLCAPTWSSSSHHGGLGGGSASDRVHHRGNSPEGHGQGQARPPEAEQVQAHWAQLPRHHRTWRARSASCLATSTSQVALVLCLGLALSHTKLFIRPPWLVLARPSVLASVAIPSTAPTSSTALRASSTTTRPRESS